METQIVRRILHDFRPQRVVHIKSTREARGWVLHDRRTQAKAAELSKSLNLRRHSLERIWLPGSLESYSTGKLGLEMITIAIPSNADFGTVWQKHRDALLHAIIFDKTSDRQRRTNGWQAVPDRSASKTSARLDAVATGRSEDSHDNSSTALKWPLTPNRESPAIPRSRYIELPPAP